MAEKWKPSTKKIKKKIKIPKINKKKIKKTNKLNLIKSHKIRMLNLLQHKHKMINGVIFHLGKDF